jgi:hypothetical protein
MRMYSSMRRIWRATAHTASMKPIIGLTSTTVRSRPSSMRLAQVIDNPNRIAIQVIIAAQNSRL